MRLQSIGGYIVIRAVIGKLHLLRTLIEIRIAQRNVIILPYLYGRIVIYRTAYLLLQLRTRHLKHTHELELHRRKRLLLLLAQ